MSSMLPVSRAVATIDARNELRPNPIRFWHELSLSSSRHRCRIIPITKHTTKIKLLIVARNLPSNANVLGGSNFEFLPNVTFVRTNQVVDMRLVGDFYGVICNYTYTSDLKKTESRKVTLLLIKEIVY